MHEKYTYRFLFHSKNKRIVLDDGDKEYPVDAAEVLLGKEYVFIGVSPVFRKKTTLRVCKILYDFLDNPVTNKNPKIASG
ncbi:hypothetical protein DN390_22045 [Bacillus sp. SH7-1]|uniref:hypothetical protein n=1 Tax=Bacillus sp. SH7-1 TaxID=2217818 RepID=UPI0011C925F3|nr:hypothetical protein DN390_22045 [Bacillus sp. SH7-1]